MKSLIPALGRLRQVDLCKCKASLIYIMGFRPARDTQWDPVLKFKTKIKKKKLEHLGGGCKIVWYVMMPVAKPGGLSTIPYTLMVEVVL